MFEASNARSVQDLAAERDALLIALLESLAATRRALAAGKKPEGQGA